jgi:hypothetical protein
MEQFLLGTISMGCAVAALLFLRFWRSSGDRLFLFFSASFAIEAINRACFAAFGHAAAEYHVGYVTARLLSFLLILIAIVNKNSVQRTE